MGRPRGFDEQQAVAAAAELFAGRSYDGTSVDDLVSRTGVHRGSLYKTFGSKRGLYLAALRHHVDQDVTRIAGSSDPARALLASGGTELGFLLLAAAERAAVDDEVAAEVGRALDLLDAALRPAGSDPDRAADLTAALLGLLLRARAQPGRATGATLLTPH
ncbi:TetR/AcrR family transcriptional regulator [Actinoplanes sp. RD1]|uniref:TetR/AcrR family transcriptional regulator n=1 Tax=Actinoplanes sp. RD1 TaxID=3064538 RepID=UPI00274071F2|nr:helix-turn-helix domain-containing protein [Actinoplanes sp. RD1]